MEERGQNDHRAPDFGTTADGPELQVIPYGQAYQAGVDSVKRLDVVAIARTCHEVNRVYCAANGDFSQTLWDDAPDWQRDSAIKGVNAALEGVTDEELHALWCDSKLQDGWTYGEVKDATAKTHPCLVSYAELPEFQRVKDTLFRTVVETLKPYL